MKKIVFTFFILFSAIKISAQVSFVGFDQPFCPDPMVNVYTYVNYLCGTPTCPHGFKVFKNGIQVNDIYGTMGSAPTCLEMKFINDSTGFAVTVNGYATSVLKTSNYGVTWTSIGSIPPVGYSGVYPGYWGLYIVNPNYAYLVANVTYSSSTIVVCRASDIDYSWTYTNQFILDDSINTNIYKTDTVFGNALCNIDSLNIFVTNPAGDTIDYHINLFSVPLGINELSDKQNPYIIYPNPSEGQINIRGDNFVSAEIFSTNGSKIKTCSSKNIDISTLSKGFYFIRIVDSGGRIHNSKFIKE